jgi:hypothetical protein
VAEVVLHGLRILTHHHLAKFSPSSSGHDVPSKHLGPSRLLALELSRLRRIATVPFMPFDTVAEREGQVRAVFAHHQRAARSGMMDRRLKTQICSGGCRLSEKP